MRPTPADTRACATFSQRSADSRAPADPGGSLPPGGKHRHARRHIASPATGTPRQRRGVQHTSHLRLKSALCRRGGQPSSTASNWLAAAGQDAPGSGPTALPAACGLARLAQVLGQYLGGEEIDGRMSRALRKRLSKPFEAPAPPCTPPPAHRFGQAQQGAGLLRREIRLAGRAVEQTSASTPRFGERRRSALDVADDRLPTNASGNGARAPASFGCSGIIRQIQRINQMSPRRRAKYR